MDDGKRSQSTSPVLSKGVIRVASLVVLLTAAVSLVVLLWAFGRGTEQNKTQLEAVRTAASIALGTGGAAALLLAARRQQTAEQVAVDTRYDAAERRITDLYTKAADQLGSEKAPVRLAGLYALERLAQDNPEHQQTIANLICAYLRMPYTPVRREFSVTEGCLAGTHGFSAFWHGVSVGSLGAESSAAAANVCPVGSWVSTGYGQWCDWWGAT